MTDKYNRPFTLLALASDLVYSTVRTYRIVLLSVRPERRQKIPRVVGNPTLRHHTPPVRHVCIVSERKDARGRELGREEGLGPRLGRVPGGPGLLTVAGQAVDENDAGWEVSARCHPGAKMYALDDGTCRAVKRLDAVGKGLGRRRGCGG